MLAVCIALLNDKCGAMMHDTNIGGKVVEVTDKKTVQMRHEATVPDHVG